MPVHYLVKPEMLIGHALPLRKKLQNLSHLNWDPQIRQISIQLIQRI